MLPVTMLQVRNITKKFGDYSALNDVSLDINSAEIVSLLGVNGAGKTTLSSIIASLHPPTAGDVFFEGVSIYNDLIEYRRKLGFCAQSQTLSSHLTVQEHLEFAGRYFLMDSHACKKRAEELIELFNLGKYAKKDPVVLSGGYKQRVLIARSIMHRPQLVILDEPTVALDPHIRRQLWEIIKDLKNQGVSVLLTTHYLDEAEVLSDRICLLHAGRVQLIDTPQALMSSYNKGRLEDVFIQLVNEHSDQ
ncbi:ABC transporter ATP-binding protein [Candidatus Dependentiae bacterium]|nr:ABC transporter ATP-binding protein [Candidatus Dependentiae bacterium]